jgi:anthranilate phosphoribosyltransferase
MSVLFALTKITSGGVLTRGDAQAAMGEIMDGAASALQVAALIGALRMRGETIDEIVGFACAMRDRAIRVHAQSTPLVDTCGTGGDAMRDSRDATCRVSTFNVSTAAAFIAAGAGAHIAKHGNRAQSSKCGSADVLEALGVNVDLAPEQIGACIDEIGIGFMFAPAHHPAMKHVGPIRKELGIRTIFNLLGPLVNPAEATCQVMGVSDARWLRPIAEVLCALGSERAIVCHAEDGLDEFSICAKTRYIELKNGELKEDVLDPRELGLACTDPRRLEGGDAARNAEIISQLLHDGEGATADIACLNAAAVLIVSGFAPNFEDGLKLARASVNSGNAREKLARLIEFTNGI